MWTVINKPSCRFQTSYRLVSTSSICFVFCCLCVDTGGNALHSDSTVPFDHLLRWRSLLAGNSMAQEGHCTAELCFRDVPHAHPTNSLPAGHVMSSYARGTSFIYGRESSSIMVKSEYVFSWCLLTHVVLLSLLF